MSKKHIDERLDSKLSIVPPTHIQRFAAVLIVLEKSDKGREFADYVWENVKAQQERGDDWNDILRFFRKMADKRDYQNFLREVSFSRLAAIPDLRLYEGG